MHISFTRGARVYVDFCPPPLPPRDNCGGRDEGELREVEGGAGAEEGEGGLPHGEAVQRAEEGPACQRKRQMRRGRSFILLFVIVSLNKNSRG